MKALRLFLQYGIGLLLLATGIGKLLDVPGFIQVLELYQLSALWLQPVIAIIVVICELRIAEALLRGAGVAIAALGSIVLHSLFTVVSVTTLLRGIELSNCGCFGVFLARPVTWQTVFEDLILVAASVSLYVLARKQRRD